MKKQKKITLRHRDIYNGELSDLGPAPYRCIFRDVRSALSAYRNLGITYL